MPSRAASAPAGSGPVRLITPSALWSTALSPSLRATASWKSTTAVLSSHPISAPSMPLLILIQRNE
jgi:hypothetical protein